MICKIYGLVKNKKHIGMYNDTNSSIIKSDYPLISYQL